MPWEPGRRKAARELEEPFVDVPPHLTGPLWRWVSDQLDPYELWERAREIAMHLRLPMPPTGYHPVTTWQAGATSASVLDLVEAILELYGVDDLADVEGLEHLLATANSAYRVNDEWTGLECRVSPSVRDAVQLVVDTATDSSGDHLRTAWNCAYGRNSDPVKSYSESIKAVEAAMASRVSPSNSKQTLGTMIRDVAAKPEKWIFAIPDGQGTGVQTVLHMMRTLWDGQSSRHGGQSPTAPENEDQARGAVHLAAALVQFGTSGTFCRRS